MRMQLAVYTVGNTALLADWSTFVRSCNVRCNQHGYESCEVEIDVPFLEAFNYYQQNGPLKVKVSWGGGYRVWEGRLDDPTQFTGTKSGLRIVAFGGWVAYSDIPYIALWSKKTFDEWRIYLSTDDVGFSEMRYEFNISDRLIIAPRKGEILGSTGTVKEGGVSYDIPHLSGRQITGISFDFELSAFVNWTGRLISYTLNPYTFVAVPWSLNGNNGIQGGAVHLTLTACDRLVFGVRYTPADAAYAGETGQSYLRITNLRVVTATANRVNTTLTANRNAGSNVTASVVSTSRMYVGQQLVMNSSPGAPSETVTVLSIGSSTQFNATFVGNYLSGQAVQAHVIYPDEIIKHCVTSVNAINPNEVASDQSLIQSQALDIDQAVYEDIYPADIINQLIAKSDTQARQWVAMVYDDKRLIVRPRGTGTTWYTDIADLEVVRPLVELFNSVYAVYDDPTKDRKLRTAISSDALSIDNFDITRRKAVGVDTTSSVQATFIRDTVLDAESDPIPRTSIEITNLMDRWDNPYPLFFARSDDILVIRNLPPIIGAIYDKIRTLIIVRTDYDVINNKLTVELELPLPQLSILIAQALKGVTP